MTEQKLDPQPRFLSSCCNLLSNYSLKDFAKKISCVQVKLESVEGRQK